MMFYFEWCCVFRGLTTGMGFFFVSLMVLTVRMSTVELVNPELMTSA